MTPCKECSAPTEFHWLCARHRKRLGKSALQSAALKSASVTETHLLSELVFDFPTACGQHEAWVRARFAMRACTSPNRVRFVLRLYGIRGARVARGVGLNDAAAFFERLVTFMCLFVPSSHARIARVIERKYPVLARTHIECAERILGAVERATGSPRAFFTRADLAPLARRIPLDLVHYVHAEYILLFLQEHDRTQKENQNENQTLVAFFS